jgi:voltage-gated potassium channel
MYFGLIAALVLGAAILLGVFESLSPFEALYLTITTLTTLGYGDLTPLTAAGRLTSMVLAVGGLLLVFGVGVEVVQEGLARTLSGRDRRMEKDLAQVSGHHIICGYGRLGERTVDQLIRLGQKVAVVEREQAVAASAAARGFPTVTGDALVQDHLVQAGIARARSVVATFPSDADNVYLILECRELRRDIEVICTASGQEAARRMYLAGATRVISPHTVAAEMVAKSAINPAVIQLMSEVTDATAMSENLTQIVVAPGSKLVGKTLAELPRMGVTVKIVAAKDGGSLSLPQGGDFTILAGALLVVAGTVDQLAKLELLSRVKA